MCVCIHVPALACHCSLPCLMLVLRCSSPVVRKFLGVCSSPVPAIPLARSHHRFQVCPQLLLGWRHWLHQPWGEYVCVGVCGCGCVCMREKRRERERAYRGDSSCVRSLRPCLPLSFFFFFRATKRSSNALESMLSMASGAKKPKLNTLVGACCSL